MIKNIIKDMNSFNIDNIKYINSKALEPIIQSINNYSLSNYLKDTKKCNVIDILDIKKFESEISDHFAFTQSIKIDDIVNPWNIGKYSDFMTPTIRSYYYLKVYLENNDLSDLISDYLSMDDDGLIFIIPKKIAEIYKKFH
jgi:hypothetical protein